MKHSTKQFESWNRLKSYSPCSVDSLVGKELCFPWVVVMLSLREGKVFLIGGGGGIMLSLRETNRHLIEWEGILTSLGKGMMFSLSGRESSLHMVEENPALTEYEGNVSSLHFKEEWSSWAGVNHALTWPCLYGMAVKYWGEKVKLLL